MSYASDALIDAQGREIEKLKTENAKLRELLCELYEDQCDDGDRWKYRDRMSKFGIEVD